MKRSILVSIKEKLSNLSGKPWACFETTGLEEDGRIAFSISCNRAFVANLKKYGFQGTNDEEIVQMFFLSTRMAPESLLDFDNTINPSATPNLTSEANTLVR